MNRRAGQSFFFQNGFCPSMNRNDGQGFVLKNVSECFFSASSVLDIEALPGPGFSVVKIESISVK